MPNRDRLRIPLRSALTMAWNYARMRLAAQVRSVAFILVYLLGFQVLVLGTAPAQALQIAAGVALVVVGLAAFLEGLFLGLMPLGEQVGLRLPQRFGISAIMVFGLLLGLGATFAEPAIAALRTAGQEVTPWAAPLLYRLLERDPERLVLAISAGVGVAVAFGMLRFYRGMSIKPFVYIVIPVLLLCTILCACDPLLEPILGLAWDAGVVTTGPVTVPLILALGIGVSRAIGKQEGGAGSSFGVVMLASAFPVLGVLLLGVGLRFSTPAPVPERAFLAPANRATALRLVPSEDVLRRLAFERGGEEGRRAFFGDESRYREAVRSLADPRIRRDLLGAMPLQDWFLRRASEAERALLPLEDVRPAAVPSASEQVRGVLRGEARLAFRAVIPLSALLLLVLLAVLRSAPRYGDEVVFGLVLTLVGMGLLTSGIRLGLAPLGDQVGRPLPRVFRSVAREEGRIVLQPFDAGQVLTAFALDGTPTQFFHLKDGDGVPRPVPFDPARYDAAARRYEHIVKRPPLFGPQLTLAGIALVFLFAFGMGYGSTLAEPALSALGRTVEELSVGTIRGAGVIRAVSVGVGVGLVAGVARILYDVPLVWLLVPPYLALLPLTARSEEDFAAVAWDCGGVTTGPVTVPLVLAMGIGIGGELKVVDGFGVLAMASVYPIIAVLLYGMVVRARQRRSMEPVSGEEDDV